MTQTLLPMPSVSLFVCVVLKQQDFFHVYKRKITSDVDFLARFGFLRLCLCVPVCLYVCVPVLNMCVCVYVLCLCCACFRICVCVSVLSLEHKHDANIVTGPSVSLFVFMCIS